MRLVYVIFSMCILFPINDVLGQFENNKDTIIVDSTINEITTIKYTASGFGGGLGGHSPRIRMFSFSVKDTLGVVIHSGFIYKRQNACISEIPYSVIYSYNADGSYDVTTFEQKRLRVKRRTEHFVRYRKPPKTKRPSDRGVYQEQIMRKIMWRICE